MSSALVESTGDGSEKMRRLKDAEIGALCQPMKLDYRYDKNGKVIVVERIEFLDDADQEEKYKAYALVLRRFFDEKHRLTQTKLDINSRPILRVFSEIVMYYPAHPEMFSEVLTIDAPYKILYHHWQELKDYRNKTEDDETRMHLNFLLAFMNRELGEDSKKADRLLETGHMSFPLLWTIFRPGELVIQLIGQHPQLWRLVETSYGRDREKDQLILSLKVTCSSYDGAKVGRHHGKIKLIKNYEDQGVYAITSLAAFPLRFLDNSVQIIEKLIERGQRFLDLRGIHFRRYEGQLLEYEPPSEYIEDKGNDFKSYSIQGRIVIDIKTFVEENSSAEYERVDNFNDIVDENSSKSRPPSPIARVSELDMNSSIPLTAATSKDKFQLPPHTIKSWKSDDLMLFPPYVYGFSPGNKKWGRFFVDQIRDPQWNPDMFNGLILPDTPKKVVRSLVRSHQFPSEGARDRQVKGKGLVVLLQGTPGTGEVVSPSKVLNELIRRSGKTLTAEVASELTERVLLVISSGELGKYVSEIEENLTKFLQYATIWGAIALIDEADVFLEARTSGANNRLEQNSLVAVFLRQLEYFQGIIFLTTNRGTSLDLAIKSRIHLFLQFLPPDLQTRRTMWQLRLGKKDPSEQDFDIEKALEIVEEANMNGREISNAVQTIWTLARDEEKKVSLEHFRTFIQVWESFEHGKVIE